MCENTRSSDILRIVSWRGPLRASYAFAVFLNPRNVMFRHRFTIQLIDVHKDNNIVVRGRHVVVGTQEGIAGYVLSEGLVFAG